MIHPEKHELAGHQVIMANGKKRTIDDWFDRLSAKPWNDVNSIATVIYRIKVGRGAVPVDNEVVSCEGALYHVSEIISVA